MSYRSLVLAVAALSLAHVASAGAQSVYVAPGGVYVGSGPVYVIPAPNTPYAGPEHTYGPPAVVAPGYVPSAYGLNGGPPLYPRNGGYYEPPPISAYAAAGFPPRPPALIPYPDRRCVAHPVYPRWRHCD